METVCTNSRASEPARFTRSRNKWTSFKVDPLNNKAVVFVVWGLYSFLLNKYSSPYLRWQFFEAAYKLQSAAQYVRKLVLSRPATHRRHCSSVTLAMLLALNTVFFCCCERVQCLHLYVHVRWRQTSPKHVPPTKLQSRSVRPPKQWRKLKFWNAQWRRSLSLSKREITPTTTLLCFLGFKSRQSEVALRTSRLEKQGRRSVFEALWVGEGFALFPFYRWQKSWVGVGEINFPTNYHSSGTAYVVSYLTHTVGSTTPHPCTC